MALDSKLLEILACPEDKGPLLYFADENALYNPRLKRRYLVQDDIPIMLIDEAETVDDAEDTRLTKKAELRKASRRPSTNPREQPHRFPALPRRGPGAAGAARDRARGRERAAGRLAPAAPAASATSSCSEWVARASRATSSPPRATTSSRSRCRS